MPLPLPIPEHARPLTIRPDVDIVSNRTGGDASPLGSLPVRTSLPQSLPSGSAPISMPVRNPPSAANASPSSSFSSSPRPRCTSALGSVSSQGIDFPGTSGLGGVLRVILALVSGFCMVVNPLIFRLLWASDLGVLAALWSARARKACLVLLG